MARSIRRIKHGSGTRKVPRPAQGNHTNDRYPVTIAAGSDNVRTSGVRPVNNNTPRRAL